MGKREREAKAASDAAALERMSAEAAAAFPSAAASAEELARDTGEAVALWKRGEHPIQLADEPTARLVGIWVVEGQGWRWATVELPQSLVERYAVSVGGPEVLPIAIGKSVEVLEGVASRGVVR